MPLNYASWEQVSGWRFLLHRLSVGVGRFTVRLVHDPSKNESAALLVSAVVGGLLVGLAYKGAENSEVLPAPSVAVAVTYGNIAVGDAEGLKV